MLGWGLGRLRIRAPLRGRTCPRGTGGSECLWAADGEARSGQAQGPSTAAGTARTLTETTSLCLLVPLGPTVQARRPRLRTRGDPLGHAAGECRRGPPGLRDFTLCVVLVTRVARRPGGGGAWRCPEANERGPNLGASPAGLRAP